ncbi:ATP-dependent DNA helicase [Polynucleobacter kasalickyi]|uniref:UvrD-like helicase C-terminal domain-containing protein n=1 Tax=Polynucleobacter kasalickyi TaxID=1938817 RepID=A0A1W2BM14_9BURK|nr:AAA family ATPase [Polynucleobacter kasalickyi]SMC73910.1 UvrD-like helicase C-terminal domain-containing protein [Polynucleobacter kasalickyi]
MKFSEISKILIDQFNLKIIVIQGNKETLYCYGDKAKDLAIELNISLPADLTHSLKIPSSQIEKCEDHLKSYGYKYAILELHEFDLKTDFNKKNWIVTRTSSDEAIGITFDNKNLTGEYPRKRKTILETILLPTELSLDEDTSITLNEEQIQILTQIDNWLSNDNQIAIISGRAGTGKTTLLKYVVKLIEKRKKTLSLLAPTGRAARVITKKTGVQANTIHSEIYVLDSNSIKMSEDPESQQRAFEESDFSLNFKLKEEENLAQIYIVDEASLIGDSLGSQGDLNFGTGRLLNDLLTQIGVIHRKNTSTKILFVGDSYQLPPVRENSSPALDILYMSRTFKLTKLPEFYELTKVMRQSENSLILQNAEIIRSQINDKKNGFISLKFNDKDFYHSDAISVQKEVSNQSLANRIMITRSNQNAHGFNKSIRSRRFKGLDTSQPQINDLIIVNTNSSKYGCYNGDIYSIIELSERQIITVVLEKSSRFKHKPETVNLLFRDILIRPIEFIESNKFDKQVKVIENLLNSPENALDKSESIGLHVDWNNRTKLANLTVEEKKKDLLHDPYINAVQIKYAYAITCHKSQGGEWPHAGVFLEGKLEHESDFRWLYTAVTRATKTLSLINASYLEDIKN